MPAAPSSFAPQLWLLAMNLVWGISYSAVKYCLDRGMPPFAMMTARFSLAVLVLLPLVVNRPREVAEERNRGIVTGLALLVGYVLQTLGMAEASASTAGLMSGLITLLVAAGGWLLFRERMRATTAIGLAMGLVGLLVMFAGTGGDPNAKDSPTGIALLVGASVSFACHILLMSRWSRPGRATVYCWWQLVTVAAGVLVLAPFQGGLGAVATHATDPWIAANLVYLAVFALAIAIVVQSRVQRLIPATRVAVIFATQPLFGALGGMLLLGDTLDACKWAGGALITGGVLVAELLRPRNFPTGAA